MDENGEYQGYDIYLARRLGEDLGVEINFVSTEAANRIEYLQTGKVDVILANFTVTPERSEEVDFASPYMNVALGVVSPNDNVIESLDDWNSEDEMIVISGTTAETYLMENYPDIKLQKYDSYATAKTLWKMEMGQHGQMTIQKSSRSQCKTADTQSAFPSWGTRIPLPPQYTRETPLYWTGSMRKSKVFRQSSFSTLHMTRPLRILMGQSTRKAL